MISALSWVARAAAKDIPINKEFTAEEFKDIMKAASEQTGAHRLCNI
jgi:hypothetical protein